jgi:isoquinoline 1-oxidoreductase subunit beta
MSQNTNTNTKLNRRSFVKLVSVAGGGLALGFYLGDTPNANADDTDFKPNAFLQIASSGEILLYAIHPEIGQGVKTSLPMIIAEELDANWHDVRVEQAEINRKHYGRQAAGGSQSTPSTWDALRQAGATARTMLIHAAADIWQVKPETCKTQSSFVIHPPTKRQLAYSALADKAASVPTPDKKTVKLKARKDYQLLGKRVSGVDNLKLVTGQPLFGIDQTLPGMLYATYQKCPAIGGRIKTANLDEIRQLPGVIQAFFLEGNNDKEELQPGVAIVADSTWAAFSAKQKLNVKWDERSASKDSWSKAQQQAKQMAQQKGKDNILNTGNVHNAFSENKPLEAFYSYPFLPHATLEPQNTTAWYKDGRIELWSPTQNPDRAIKRVAKLLDIDSDKVTFHQTRVGGGFGRRLMVDYACEAAAIAKRVNAPVKLQWTREDDMAHDFYRAGGFHALKGSVNSAGKITAWHDHFITFSNNGESPARGAKMSGKEFPLPFLKNTQLTSTLQALDIPCGYWRAPASNGLAFAMQSFLDELAIAGGRDFRDLLLELLSQPNTLDTNNQYSLKPKRAIDVIKLATQKAGWGKTLEKGRGLGLAFYYSHSGYFAEVAEVSVDSDKKLTVHKITAAGDVGPIINLSAAEAQCVGSMVDGLSTMLGLQVTIENGRIQESNFHQYPMLRINKIPEVEIHFIESDNNPTGLGEPALPPVAPAICNAICAASGLRVRHLPLSKEGFSI